MREESLSKSCRVIGRIGTIELERMIPHGRSDLLCRAALTRKQQGPVSSRSPSVRRTKSFPTESEAKQFAKAKLSEGMKVTAGTLILHQPIRRMIIASDINRWIEEDE
jgi:hypothetical protein